MHAVRSPETCIFNSESACSGDINAYALPDGLHGPDESIRDDDDHVRTILWCIQPFRLAA